MLRALERKLDKVEKYVLGAATPEEVQRQFNRDRYYFEQEKKKALAKGDRKLALKIDHKLKALEHQERKLKYSQVLVRGAEGKKMYKETMAEQTEELKYLYDDDQEVHIATIGSFDVIGDMIDAQDEKEYNDGSGDEEEEDMGQMMARELPSVPTHFVRLQEEDEEERVFTSL